MNFKILLLIGAGSFIGGICRYLISFPFYEKYPNGFPWGTLIVNIVGCLFIGLLYSYAERMQIPKEWRLFLATGILGGFTTFSSFSHETITLYNNGEYTFAFVYVLASVLLGLVATFLGYYFLRMNVG